MWVTPAGRTKRHCVMHRWVLSGLFPALRNDAPGIKRHGPAPIHLRVTACECARERVCVPRPMLRGVAVGSAGTTTRTYDRGCARGGKAEDPSPAQEWKKRVIRVVVYVITRRSSSVVECTCH